MKKTKRILTTMLVIAMMATSVLRVNAATPELTERNEYWYKASTGFVQEQKEEAERIKICSGIMALKQDDTATGYAQIKVNERLEKGYLRDISYEQKEEKTVLKAVFETFESVVYEIEIYISEYNWRGAIEAQKLKAAEYEKENTVAPTNNKDSMSAPEPDSESTTQPDPVPPFGGVVDPMPPSDDIDGVHTQQPAPSPAPDPDPVPAPQPDPVPPFAGTQGPTPPSVDIDGVH